MNKHTMIQCALGGIAAGFLICGGVGLMTTPPTDWYDLPSFLIGCLFAVAVLVYPGLSDPTL